MTAVRVVQAQAATVAEVRPASVHAGTVTAVRVFQVQVGVMVVCTRPAPQAQLLYVVLVKFCWAPAVRAQEGGVLQPSAPPLGSLQAGKPLLVQLPPACSVRGVEAKSVSLLGLAVKRQFCVAVDV